MITLCLIAMAPAAKAQTTDPLPGWTTSQPVLTVPGKTGEITVAAFLTNSGQPLTHGVIWRVYQASDTGAKLLEASRAPAPTFELPPGRYIVNAAYGLAYLTRAVDVRGGQRATERFVINAGGLRVFATLADGSKAAPGTVSYDIYSDERDRSGQRMRILSNARPGKVIRLNSGIYEIVSTMGDANAQMKAEVTVEAGKLTEATFAHDAAKCTFKLVRQTGGEAIAGVKWIIQDARGNVVKESGGALPTHILAPGAYSVGARFNGSLYTRTFSVRSGEAVEVEVLLQ